MKILLKYCFAVLLLFLNCLFAVANNSDSLVQLIQSHTKQDEKYVDLLIEIAESFREDEDYASLYQKAEDIIHTSSKIGYDYGAAYGNYLLGAYYFDTEKQLPALENLKSALFKTENLSESINKQILLFKIRRTFGVYYYRYSMISEAMIHTPIALEIAENLHNAEFIYSAKINLAVLHAELNGYQTAIETLETLSDSLSFLIFYKNYNIGTCFLKLNQPDSALHYFNIAINDSISNTHKSLLCSKIGESYLQKKDFSKAKSYLSEALQLKDTLQDFYALTQIFNNLASTYLAINDFKTAIHYINLSIETAQTHQLLKEESDSRLIKSNILEKSGRFKESLEELHNYIVLKDSLKQVMDIEKANIQLLQNELNIKEVQFAFNLKQEQERHSQARQQWFLIIIMLFLAIMVILLFLSRKNILLKNKQISEEILKQKLENSNKELTSNVMQQLKTKELLSEVKDNLSELNKKSNVHKGEINTIVRKMNFSMKDQASWDKFDMYFIQTHQSFYDNLTNDFPSLTVNDKRLCALLRLNLTTKEISGIINIKPDSVHAARTRIRKKLNLDLDESLLTFLQKY